MKVIFSRKGVDSASGGIASPLVEGRPVSLPIPTRQPSPTRYCDLAEPYRKLARDLSGGKLARQARCHLDPDLDPAALAYRPAGWRGSLGQCGSALGHLRNQQVGVGDLFLFWGLFRDVERTGGRWRWAGPRQHCLFGWLYVGEVLEAGEDGSHCVETHPWLRDHPHARPGWMAGNAIYCAAESFQIGGQRFAGSGLLERAVRLSAGHVTKPSLWRAPGWLDPNRGGTGLSFHQPQRWQDGCLQSVARGQEFVADIGERTDAREWLANLLGKGQSSDCDLPGSGGSE